MARVDRLGAEDARRASARTSCSNGSSTTRAAPAPTCRSSRTPRTSTRSPPGQEPEYPGNRAIERRIEAYIRWNALAMVVHANRHRAPSTAATSPATHRRRRSTKWASTISGARRRTSIPATWCSSRATRRRASTRAPSRRPPHRGPAASTSARKSQRRRPVVVSASVADAGLLAVPDGVDGPRAR